MDEGRAIKLLEQALSEIYNLRQLQHDNQQYPLWHNRILAVLEAIFGLDSKEREKFWHPDIRAHILRPLLTEDHFQEDYILNLKSDEKNLKSVITTLKARKQRHKILQTLESEAKPAAIAEPKDSVELPLNIYDSMQFHPKVIEASRKLFQDEHYRDAIYRAFVEVNNLVKKKANSQLDGRALMSEVFRLENPIIKLNPLITQSDRDEQEGFMFLFMGAMEGIRNPKAHENIVQNDPYKALKYLSLASLLIETIDFWEAT